MRRTRKDLLDWFRTIKVAEPWELGYYIEWSTVIAGDEREPALEALKKLNSVWGTLALDCLRKPCAFKDFIDTGTFDFTNDALSYRVNDVLEGAAKLFVLDEFRLPFHYYILQAAAQTILYLATYTGDDEVDLWPCYDDVYYACLSQEWHRS
jgi:hypothetical protein